MPELADLSGTRFGRLTVVRRHYGRHPRVTWWECRCDCGNAKVVRSQLLTSGKTSHCGCARVAKPPGNRGKLIGRRFGRIVVIRSAGSKDWMATWVCRCDCGRTSEVPSERLLSGNTKSCGCGKNAGAIRQRVINRSSMLGLKFGELTVTAVRGHKLACKCECGRSCEATRKALIRGGKKSCGCLAQRSRRLANRTHGMSGTASYRIWQGILTRCRNSRTRYWKNYGGRGIRVCDRWESFANFIADMGHRPPGMSIDRINTNGNYSPDNCRWATPLQQGQNTRRNVFVDYQGATVCLSEFARLIGSTPRRIHLQRRLARIAETSTRSERRAIEHYRRSVYESETANCYWCGRSVPKEHRHVDHIIPLSKRGRHSVWNLCCACDACNTSKNARLPHEFDRQFLLNFQP